MATSKLQSLLIALVLTAIGVSAQNPSVRGIYVNGTSTFLGDTTKENQVLRYVQLYGYNYLAMYNLNMAWTTQQQNLLASFISKAKTKYGVVQVGACGESSSFFINNILPFNASRASANEKFDVLNFEFEFWITHSINAYYCAQYLIPNGYTCDSTGAFAYGYKEFQVIDSICTKKGLLSEIYLGWPNAGQMRKITSLADRILLHAYRKTDADVYNYSRNRLLDIAAVKSTVNVIPIFSGEPDFMQAYLYTNPVTKPYQKYYNDYLADTGSIKQYINIQGYHWFVYSYMPNPYAPLATITEGGPTSFCAGGYVTLTANQQGSYMWIPGGQTTQSITVSSSGSYKVKITNSIGLTATSQPVTVFVSPQPITPVITASAPLTVCQGRAITLTASLSHSYLWSNGATTQSITTTTSGNYSVTSTTFGCTATSAISAVNVVPPPPAPGISSTGSLNVCPGDAVVLTATPAGGYLWSNGATTRSIAVSAAGNYDVRTYTAPFCFNTSQPVTVSQLAAPATPVITANSSTTLTGSHPSVSLTSSVANSYSWSNSLTSRTISVSNPGSYRVTVTKNGCKATSSPVMVSGNGCTPPAAPLITASGPTDLQPGQTVVLTSTLASGYRWSNGATTRSITVSTSGTFTVRAYKGGNCFSTSLPVTVRILPARLRAEATIYLESKDFNVYPNPASETVNIQYFTENSEKCLVRIADMSGKVVYEKEVDADKGSNDFSLNISSLRNGFYNLYIAGDEKINYTKLFVVSGR